MHPPIDPNPSREANARHRLRSGVASLLQSRPVLLIAFAFAVMGDPVSSVAYAIEAALRALDGGWPAVADDGGGDRRHRAGDRQLSPLVARFPGGGDAAAAGAAFGEGWAFLPLGSLIVDYALTIAISVRRGSSAIIAYVPGWAGRLPLALSLLVLVAGLTWFGQAAARCSR